MAGLYFPKTENLIPFTVKEMEAVQKAVKILKEQTVLPRAWKSDIEDIHFYKDSGMTVDNGVMGMTSFLKQKRILIASFLIEQLTWESSGVPNNEMAMAIIIHELTHSDQMTWWGGLAYLILNIPGIDKLTLEKWAVENQNAAERFLQETYQEMRK